MKVSTPSSRDGLGRYAIAIGAVLLTALVKLHLLGLGSEHPFVLLTAPIALAAWYGGLGPGVLATLLAIGTSVFFILPPVGSGAEQADLLGFGALAVSGGLVVGLTVGLRSAWIRAEAAGAASAAAYRETAFALAVRDEMLALWTQQLRGPMADLEAQAREALDDFEREGYSGAAARKLRKLVDDASLVGRVTAGWDQQEGTKA
jgi:K+-sensing histidine kinase KdpD